MTKSRMHVNCKMNIVQKMYTQHCTGVRLSLRIPYEIHTGRVGITGKLGKFDYKYLRYFASVITIQKYYIYAMVGTECKIANDLPNIVFMLT